MCTDFAAPGRHEERHRHGEPLPSPTSVFTEAMNTRPAQVDTHAATLARDYIEKSQSFKLCPRPDAFTF